MFSKVIQITMSLTSLSPVLLTFWFKEFSRDWDLGDGLIYLIVFGLLLVWLYIILKLGRHKLEKIPINIKKVSNDSKINVPFILSYIVPIFELDMSITIFLLALFFFVITVSNLYPLNPLIGVLGFRQYKINTESGLTFILITKKNLVNVNQIKKVSQLSNYVLLDVSKI